MRDLEAVQRINMIEINDFIAKVADQFVNTDPSMITSGTNFWELDEWSSFVAISVVAMIEEEYQVSLHAKDVKGAKTIGDLFLIVRSKMN